jgi:hypothetical protein
MEETRTSLTEKLEALESQVADTVKSATDVVSEATENVKETVETVTEGVKETVSTVAETFNLQRQFERRPWAMFGGSVALGMVVGYLVTRPSRRYRYVSRGAPPPAREESRTNGAAGMAASSSAPETPAPAPEPYRRPSEPSTFSWLGEQLSHLKNLGVSALMGVVRDLVSRQLPEALSQRFAQEIDQMTRRMGGEPIHGSLLPERTSGGSEEHRREGDGSSGQSREGHRSEQPEEAGRQTQGSTGARR